MFKSVPILTRIAIRYNGLLISIIGPALNKVVRTIELCQNSSYGIFLKVIGWLHPETNLNFNHLNNNEMSRFPHKHRTCKLHAGSHFDIMQNIQHKKLNTFLLNWAVETDRGRYCTNTSFHKDRVTIKCKFSTQAKI